MEAVMNKVKIEKYPAYKESGVEWLGEIPMHWELTRLKYEINYKKGKNPKNITLEETKYVYLSMEYLRGASQKVQYVNQDRDLVFVKDDNILLLWDGSNAGEFIKGKSGVLSSTMALINVCNAHKQFAWYYLKFLEVQLRRTTVGMGIPHVSSDELSNMFFLTPTIEEQTAIAAFLDRKTAQIDKAIAQKEKLIELLKEHRQILIHKAVTRGLNPHVRMKDSGVEWIGEIPEHWKIVANRSLFEERDEPGNEFLPILSVSIHTAVSSEELEEDENIRGRIRIEDKSNYKLVLPNDIVFNMMRAWQGAIGVVRVTGMVSPAYIVAKLSKTINGEYFEYQYRTQAFIQQMDRYSKGITDFRKRLYWNEFKQLLTILPPIEEQEEIVAFIQKLTEKTNKTIVHKEKEIEKLKEYKITLTNAAVTGKIKVS